MQALAIAALGAQLLAPAAFNLSNTLGDGMVLQRGKPLKCLNLEPLAHQGMAPPSAPA